MRRTPTVDRRVNAAASPESIKHCGVNAAVCAQSLRGAVRTRAGAAGLSPPGALEPTAFQAVVA
ncbi:MAG TPA: hypothetical protein VJZ25_03590 [Gemmatimonadaceae bacterium]|nr:hypothetical protein [Gemmatimonadaceae bacterium]